MRRREDVDGGGLSLAYRRLGCGARVQRAIGGVGRRPAGKDADCRGVRRRAERRQVTGTRRTWSSLE
jgi:hypothetical protein